MATDRVKVSKNVSPTKDNYEMLNSVFLRNMELAGMKSGRIERAPDGTNNLVVRDAGDTGITDLRR